jgi:hypothetical protein
MLPVEPDGYIDFEFDGQYKSCLMIELDRGTEGQEIWRRKVRALLRYAQGPYHQDFGTDALTVCVVTTTSRERLQHLYQWTMAELTAEGAQSEADLFRLSHFEPAQLSPQQQFCGAGWFTPFGRQPEPLVDPALIQSAQTGTASPRPAAAP